MAVRWETSTTATVSPGSCRNEANTNKIELADEETVNAALAHSGANGLAVLNGMDEKGLDNLTVSPITCSQSFNIITATGDLRPHLVEHSLTGMISISGVTITGVGTKFLTEVSPFDLVGSAAWDGGTGAHLQIVSIESDTSMTIGPFGIIHVGAEIGTVIHNATIQPNDAAIDKILALNMSGTRVIVGTSVTHAAGSPLTIGVHAAATWLAVWVIDDGVTPGLLISTQHETLLAPPSGYTSFRRVGWIYNESSTPVLREIFYPDGGLKRHAVYEMGSQPVQVIATNSNGVWTSVDYSAVAPRTCMRLELRVVGDNTASGVFSRTFFRARNEGDAAVDRGRRIGMSAGEAQDEVIFICNCDGAQAADYGMDNRRLRDGRRRALRADWPDGADGRVDLQRIDRA
jgi:hypothetical protein